MRDETYLYEDTILTVAKELYVEYEWDIEETMNLVKILRGAGFVIREQNPRKEDIVKGVSPNRVSNPTLTGGFASGGRVGPMYYEYTPQGMSINGAPRIDYVDGRNVANATKINQTAKITNEENEND